MEKHKCLIVVRTCWFHSSYLCIKSKYEPSIVPGYATWWSIDNYNDVDNFPGYPKGVNGTQMMIELEEQAKRFGTDVRMGMITKVDFSGSVHKVWVDNDKEIHADTIIISTGASARYLGLESEEKYLLNGGGVSACAVCDGFFYKGQETVIVGAGDSACEEASYLANLCTKVTMLVRRDEFRASKIMEERVRGMENIEILHNTELDEVLGDGNVVTGVRVVNNQTQDKKEIPCTGVFIAIGHTPNTAVFKPFLDMDEGGYIINKPGSAKTNVEGVFVSGDAADHVYRQAVTAAGTGCMAALDAERYLAAKGLH